VAFISLGVIIVSTIAMTLNTLPSLHTTRRHDNGTEMTDDEDDEDGDNKYLSIIEAVCVCWMALEYVARLWASPLRYVLMLFSWRSDPSLAKNAPNCIHHLLPPCRDTEITSRLRKQPHILDPVTELTATNLSFITTS